MNTAAAATSAPMEPLEVLARFAFEQAPRLCDPGHGCGAYHRGWSMIRLLLKQGALPAGGAFFARGLAEAAVDGRCRVLLSVEADSGLAAMVLQALEGAGLVPELVLADRCATTIEQNRRLADHLGLSIELHRADILSLDCAPADAVVAHSFLNFLPPAARPATVAAWARLLRPGGLLLMHQRLGLEKRGKDRAAVEDNRASLEAAALAHGFAEDEAREIGAAGAAFWTDRPTGEPTSEPMLRAMLAEAGFKLVGLTTADRVATSSPVHVAGLVLDTPQALIMARRPAA